MKELHEAAKSIIALVLSGEVERAEEMILAFKSGDRQITRYSLIQLLIAVAQANEDSAVARTALNAFQRVAAKAPSDGDLYYNVANGYQLLYESEVQRPGATAFEASGHVLQAIKYFKKSDAQDPRALTNLGNLYDSVGRPLEALLQYDLALRIDPQFGMALGNKAFALENLAPSTAYSGSFLVMAHHLYAQAAGHRESVLDVGGHEALRFFAQQDDGIVAHFLDAGQPDALTADLKHAKRKDSKKGRFEQFYIETCIDSDLYLNVHLADPTAGASVGDSFLPRLITEADAADSRTRVNDIAFRLNEIHESFATARMLFVRSQYSDTETSNISEQTTLINSLDYSASNLYVGMLKASYKEAFSAMDKVAILLNHYLALGHNEDSVYYGNVWFDPGAERSSNPEVSSKVKVQGWRLLGLFLVCTELRGSKYSQLRNAMTHRYLRVYRGAAGPKGSYQFEDLSALTADVLRQIKFAIMYLSIFIDAAEHKNHPLSALIASIPMNSDQNLDLW